MLPNLYISLLRNLKILPKNPILQLLNNASSFYLKKKNIYIYLGISAFSLYIGISGAIAIFPQTGFIHYSALEKEFHNLKNKNGEKIEYFAFNKGL